MIVTLQACDIKRVVVSKIGMYPKSNDWSAMFFLNANKTTTKTPHIAHFKTQWTQLKVKSPHMKTSTVLRSQEHAFSFSCSIYIRLFWMNWLEWIWDVKRKIYGRLKAKIKKHTQQTNKYNWRTQSIWAKLRVP